MIIRNFGVRHGRRALAAPVLRSCLRSLSTRPAPTAVAEPSVEDQPAELAAALAYAKKRADEAKLKEEIAKIPANLKTFKKIQSQTLGLGSKWVDEYEGDKYLENPPQDASLEMLMTAQTHMGHNTALWNPDNSRYIYGIRDGIHIINLETTQAYLRRAARVVEEVAYRGGLILWVGTRKGQKQVVVKAAEMVKGCHVFQKWTPGAITNRDQILRAAPMRVVDPNDQELEGYTEFIQDMRPLKPDLVVCLNVNENYTLLYESGLANIPTIGIVDTDTNPTWVTYQIPANDDSLQSVTLISGVLARAGQAGQQRRLEDAATGKTTWETDPAVVKYQRRQFKESKTKEAQEKEAANLQGAQNAEAPSDVELDARTQDYLKKTLAELV